MEQWEVPDFIDHYFKLSASSGLCLPLHLAWPPGSRSSTSLPLPWSSLVPYTKPHPVTMSISIMIKPNFLNFAPKPHAIYPFPPFLFSRHIKLPKVPQMCLPSHPTDLPRSCAFSWGILLPPPPHPFPWLMLAHSSELS